MNLSTHFSLAEFTASQWAARAGIENEPGPVELENLKRLAMTMEAVRYALGAPIIITSGYRCPEVNRNVGGSSTSMHVQGLAADFICPGFGTPFQVAKKLMGVEAVKFDQLIHEFGRWVHLGLATPGTAGRKQLLTIDRAGTRTGLLPVRY